MHNIYYLYIGLSGEHRCPLGYLLMYPSNTLQVGYRHIEDVQEDV